MKKFYTLLAGAMLASSAFALTPAQHQLKNVDLSVLKPQQIEKVNTEMVQKLGNQSMMKIQDAQGKEWACMIGITGDFVDILGLGSFNEYPYYWMQISAQPMDESDSLLQFIVVWPSRAASLANQYEEIFTETEDGLLLNETEVLKHFSSMAEATQAASFEEVEAMFGGDKLTLEMLPGCYYTPCILAGSYTGALIKWNGTRYCPMSAINNNGQWDYSNVTSIVWESFDMDTNDVAIDFDVPYTTYTQEGNYIIPGTNRVSIAAAQLSGPATVLGFSDIQYPALQEVHIFNAGRQTYGINEYTWSYNTAFDPLNYYFICFCDPTMTYMAVNGQTGEEVQNFTESTLPVYTSSQGALTGAPGWAIQQNYSFTYMKAALWAPENSEKPYGLWSMGASDYTTDDDRNVTYKSPAKAYNLVEPLDCAAGVNDGFSGLYEGYNVSTIAEQSWLGVGDKNNGMNFKFASTLSNGHYFIGSFKGDILYHPTPNKWVSEITYLPAVGNESFDALSKGDVSVKEVVSDAPVVSTSYYNFQGQRLSSEPQQGLYIVRSVKADGTVVSKKVAK